MSGEEFITEARERVMEEVTKIVQLEEARTIADGLYTRMNTLAHKVSFLKNEDLYYEAKRVQGEIGNLQHELHQRKHEKSQDLMLRLESFDPDEDIKCEECERGDDCGYDNPGDILYGVEGHIFCPTHLIHEDGYCHLCGNPMQYCQGHAEDHCLCTCEGDICDQEAHPSWYSSHGDESDNDCGFDELQHAIEVTGASTVMVP